MDTFDSKTLLYVISSVSVTLNVVFAYFTTRYSEKIKAKADNKSKLLEWASKAAIEDFKQDRNHESEKTQSMSSYVSFYYSFFHILEKNGKITQEEFIAINEHSDMISTTANKFKNSRVEKIKNNTNKT